MRRKRIAAWLMRNTYCARFDYAGAEREVEALRQSGEAVPECFPTNVREWSELARQVAVMRGTYSLDWRFMLGLTIREAAAVSGRRYKKSVFEIMADTSRHDPAMVILHRHGFPMCWVWCMYDQHAATLNTSETRFVTMYSDELPIYYMPATCLAALAFVAIVVTSIAVK